MQTFKTKTGLELPLLDLKGKPYLQVAYRVQWARAEHPDWQFIVSLVQSTDDFTIAEAKVIDESGKTLANAFKKEDKKGFSDHIEKACTGALGRALALCGYGTSFAADELDEGTRIVDSPLQNIQPKPKPSLQAPSLKFEHKPLPQSESMSDEDRKQKGLCSKKQISRLFAISKPLGYSPDTLNLIAHQNYKAKTVWDLSWKDYEKICQYVEQNPTTPELSTKALDYTKQRHTEKLDSFTPPLPQDWNQNEPPLDEELPF